MCKWGLLLISKKPKACAQSWSATVTTPSSKSKTHRNPGHGCASRGINPKTKLPTLPRPHVLAYWLTLGTREARWDRSVSTACANTELLLIFRGHPHRDHAPAAVRICFWIIAERVQMGEVVAYRSERLLLLEPVLRKINFSTCRSGHTFKHCRRNWFKLGLPRADHINH